MTDIQIPLHQLIRIAREFADLGDAVMTQAEAVFVDDEPIEEQNPAAMRAIEEWLRGIQTRTYASDVEEALAEIAAARA